MVPRGHGREHRAAQQALSAHDGARSTRSRGRSGRGLRLPRAERRREVDHDRAPSRPDPADVGIGTGVRSRCVARCARDTPPGCLRPERGQPLALADRSRGVALLGRAPRLGRYGLSRRSRRAIRARRRQEDPCVQPRQSPEGVARRRAREPCRSSPARRADDGPRPAHGTGVSRVRARSPRSRSNGVPVVAHPERGRSSVRSDRDVALRATHRDRPVGRAARLDRPSGPRPAAVSGSRPLRARGCHQRRRRRHDRRLRCQRVDGDAHVDPGDGRHRAHRGRSSSSAPAPSCSRWHRVRHRARSTRSSPGRCSSTSWRPWFQA